MISKKSFAPFIWVFNLGARLKILPFHWNPKTQSLVKYRRKHKNTKWAENGNKYLDFRSERRILNYPLWKLLITLGLVSNIAYATFILRISFFRPENTDPAEVILGLFFCSCSTVGIPVHLFMLLSSTEEYIVYVNGLLSFNKSFGKFIIQNSNQKRSFEIYTF